MFTPALFPLIEFDDTKTPSAHGAMCWLPGWQGQADAPAEEVCLGWIGDNGQQAVATTALLSRHPNEQARRENALLLLFGGNQLHTRRRPADTADARAAITALVNADNEWIPKDIAVDSEPIPAVTTQIDETVLGYLSLSDRLVCFAAVNLDASAISLKTLSSASSASYSANPMQPISNDNLAAQAQQAAAARDDRYR